MNAIQQAEIKDWEVIEEEKKQQFQITSIDSLNWAFRKLSALKAKETEIVNLAKAEKERITVWETEQKNAIRNDVEFFESLINQYHIQTLKDDPKAKTLSTPYGKSKSRKTKEQPDKGNENAILHHVIDSGMDEYIKPSLKWADLKKSLKIAEVNGKQVVIDENGQVVPGAVVKPESISFKVEVE